MEVRMKYAGAKEVSSKENLPEDAFSLLCMALKSKAGRGRPQTNLSRGDS